MTKFDYIRYCPTLYCVYLNKEMFFLSNEYREAKYLNWNSAKHWQTVSTVLTRIVSTTIIACLNSKNRCIDLSIQDISSTHLHLFVTSTTSMSILQIIFTAGDVFKKPINIDGVDGACTLLIS